MGKTGEQAEEALSWDEDEVVRVIVELSQQPALESMSVESVQTAASAETAALKSQESTIYQVERTLGLEPVHRMGYIMNTVSYDVRRGDIDALRAMPGVASVTEAVRYQPEMISAKEIAQVYEAWKLGDTGYTGKEMVIAVIDSGGELPARRYGAGCRKCQVHQSRHGEADFAAGPRSVVFR